MEYSKKLQNIKPILARAILVVEEGEVEVIIDDYKVSFTIQESSQQVIKVLLNNNKPSIRKLLNSYGAEMTKQGKDEVLNEEFKKHIFDMYTLSNSRGGSTCNWTIENYDTLYFKNKD